MLYLQQTIGNQAVGRIIQAKLKVNQPGDRFEQEADQIADAMMGMPETQAQQQSTEEDEPQPQTSRDDEDALSESNDEDESRAEFDEANEGAQQQPAEDEETIRAKGRDNNALHLSPKATTNIQNLRSGGQPLPKSTRVSFENRFGADFGQVRVHTGGKADETASMLNARAFTVGRNVVFGEGQYAPETSEGQHLLAHELTHVVQQQGAGARASSQGVQVHHTGGPRVQGGFFGDVWKGIKGAAGAVWKGAKAVGRTVWKGLKIAGKFTWRGIKAIAKWGWNILKSAGAWVWDLVTELPIRVWRLLKHLGSGIYRTVLGLWRGLKGTLGHLWKAGKGIFKWAGKGVVGFFSWIWQGLKGGGQWAWKLLKGDFSGFWEGIGGFFSWLGNGAVALVKWGWQGLKAAAIWAWEGVKGLAKWLWNGFLAGAAWAGRLIAKLLDLIGFGEIWDLFWQIPKFFSTRTLTSVEIAEAKRVFGDSIPYWQIRVDEWSVMAKIAKLFKGKDMGIVTFHTVNFNRKINATPGSGDMGWLIHELIHVAQMEHVGSQYLGEAIHAQATTGYAYTLGKPHLRDYNREQQGNIVRDYYFALTTGASTAAYNTYIAELKAGKL